LRAAVVDIGTNSVRLLVADSENEEVKVVKTGLITTRLGEGIGQQPHLLRPAIERTLAALKNFRRIIERSGAETVVAAATSAVRDAENRAEFLSEVKEQVGWDVRVLSGAEEAQLSYAGAVRGLEHCPGFPVVIDIGGGSTELIWSGVGGLNFVSLRVGAVRMTEGNCTLTEIEEMLASTLKSIKDDGFERVIGVGGTFTTLAAIDQELKVYNPDRVHGYILKRQRIEDIVHHLESMSIAERKKIPGLQPQRADIIMAGARIALAAVMGLDAATVIVSETDIMYGLLFERLGIHSTI